jgi:hypothetical protein
VQSPSCLVKGATEELDEFWKTLVDAMTLSNGGQNGHPKWAKPVMGNIKINWDAALDGRKKLMGVGIIARDSTSGVMVVMCSTLPYIRDPAVAEAISAKRAVEFGREMGFPSIELEGDAREIVLALGSSEERCGAYGNIIMEIRLLLGSFLYWRVGHVGRQGNMVAHQLAKFAVAHHSQHVWVGVCPSVVMNVVCTEHAS